MYQQGHYARVTKPSRRELYEDASRILEELLQKQLNDQLNAHGRPPRYKTHPLSTHRPVTSGEVLDERDEVGMDDGIERSKTMPSRMRGSPKDEPLDLKDQEHLQKKGERRPRILVSSADSDTEGDSASVSEHRKKKSLFKKATVRLMHAFHRQQRQKEIDEKSKDSPQNSPRKQRKKAPGKGDNAEKNGFKDSQGTEDKRRGTLDSKDGNECSQTEVYVKRRSSGGRAILNSIKKSFRSKRDDKRNFLRDGSDRTRPPDEAVSGSSKSYTPPSEQEQISAQHLPMPSDDRHAPPPPAPAPGSFLDVVQMARGKDSTVSPHEKSPSPFPHSTSTDSYLDTGNKSSSLYSFSSAHQDLPHVKNVLDDPGDDIKFMDTEENGAFGDESVQRGAGAGPRTKGARLIQAQGGALSRGGEDELGRRMPSGSRPRWSFKHQSSLCTDGDNDADMKDGNDRGFGTEGDLPLHERTKEEKEEMYGIIAQKLIHMADTYAAESGLSDAESHHREAGGQSSAGGDGQTELEREIVECLRSSGDRNFHLIEGPAEEMVHKAKAETYERFQRTVQHSLGEEVSWNHLAFLFYTTKGVISAVGKGSKLASDAKEMTLRYFSEKFANWILDQGGFDGVLSESDSELD